MDSGQAGEIQVTRWGSERAPSGVLKQADKQELAKLGGSLLSGAGGGVVDRNGPDHGGQSSESRSYPDRQRGGKGEPKRSKRRMPPPRERKAGGGQKPEAAEEERRPLASAVEDLAPAWEQEGGDGRRQRMWPAPARWRGQVVGVQDRADVKVRRRQEERDHGPESGLPWAAEQLEGVGDPRQARPDRP